MKHEMKARYPAPSSVVMKMFADRDFHTRKLEATGYSGKYQVLNCVGDANSFSIRIERKVPVSMPGMGKNAPESTVVNDETWSLASKTGRVVVELKGMPLEMSCVTSMKDEGKDCVVTYQWEVKSKIPLVGGTIEKMVVNDMDKKAEEETQAAIALLKNYR
ncbi:DUF2505 domain-containing protein [Stagnimonas aquatica]|uniref:DUF2505 domain-containing protein n=1 Tax=Stagnimonas aquatica TaxID=2689987 RepID=A0A3N0V1S4_9GAMM|nr:DUF2505 domain-containing protein [Stagnimonas aquatica]ROH86720.1 DUF2505 domain-containing protein [Stagnimonas aquatica]